MRWCRCEGWVVVRTLYVTEKSCRWNTTLVDWSLSNRFILSLSVRRLWANHNLSFSPGDVILLLPVILVPRSELSRPVRGEVPCVVCPSHIGLSVSYYYGISRMFRPRIRTRMRQRRDGRRTVCIGTCWNGFTVMSIGVVESPRVKPITIIFGTKCANFQSDGRVIMCSFGRSDSAYQNLPITNVNSHN